MKSFRKKNLKDLLNKERSYYERLVSYIKETYFIVIFLLLKEEEISIYVASGFSILEFL